MKVVTFEFVDYHGRKTTTAEKHLEILFRLSNASQTAKLYYRSWRGHTYDMMAHTYNGATLKDNLGNTYKLVPGSNCDSRPSNNSVDKTASINPGKAIVATLVFEVPVESARTLTQLCGSTEFHAFRYHPKLHHSQTLKPVARAITSSGTRICSSISTRDEGGGSRRRSRRKSAWCPFSDGIRLVFQGLAERVLRETMKGMPHLKPEQGSRTPIDPERLKIVYDEMVLGSRARVRFEPFVCGVEKDKDANVKELFAASKNGIEAFAAQGFILSPTCTGALRGTLRGHGAYLPWRRC